MERGSQRHRRRRGPLTCHNSCCDSGQINGEPTPYCEDLADVLPGENGAHQRRLCDGGHATLYRLHRATADCPHGACYEKLRDTHPRMT